MTGPEAGDVDTVDVVELARELIAAPSPNPPGDERAVAEGVHAAVERLGLPPAVTHTRSDARPNLVVTLDFGPGGRHLALCGHLDTKPVGDAPWTVDPFTGTVAGDRLYGLGSGDMKAAVAAMLVAAARLVAAPPAAGRLSLVLAADEEDGAAYGAQHLAATRSVAADGMVIGEPGGLAADFDHLHLVSRGIARLRLVAEARQGHSSLSDLPGTRNAGVDLARTVVAVADELELPTPDDPDGLVGWAQTVNPALTFRGGVGYGVLPGVVAADTEVRLLPGAERDSVEAAFAAATTGVAERTGARLRVEFDAAPNDWLPPARVATDDPLVAAAVRACAAVLGATPPLAVFPGTTDATWFGTVQGIPTLPALGPGLLERAHGADEWVSVEAVRRSVDLYATLARDFCRATAGGGDRA